MSKYNYLCKKHKIITLTPEEFDRRHEQHRIPLQSTTNNTLHKQNSSAIALRQGYKRQRYIVTPNDSPMIHKWHELGHILHPAGGMQDLDWDKTKYSTLINELAASYWALVENDAPYKDRHVNRERLQIALRSYIQFGHDLCPDNDIFRIYARKLQVENEIKWGTFKT